MVKVLNHALIKHKLSIMREEKTSNYIFKQNLDEESMSFHLYTYQYDLLSQLA